MMTNGGNGDGGDSDCSDGHSGDGGGNGGNDSDGSDRKKGGDERVYSMRYLLHPVESYHTR